MSRAELVVFVESALRAGQPRDAVRAALEQAGWSKDQIADALAHYADVAFAVPVPRPRAQVSARGALVYDHRRIQDDVELWAEARGLTIAPGDNGEWVYRRQRRAA